MKEKSDRLKSVLGKNLCYIFAVLSLAFPAILLVKPEHISIFGEQYKRLIMLSSGSFTLFWIGLILMFCFVVLPKRAGRIVYGIVSAFFTVLAFCQYIYFEIFGQFFWLRSIALASEGAEYVSYAAKYIDLRLILCTVISVGTTVLTIIKWKKPNIPTKFLWLGVIPVLGIAATHMFMQPELFGVSRDDWDSWAEPRVVYEQFNDINKSCDVSGFYQLTFRDLWNTVFPAKKYSEEAFSRVDEYLEKKANPKENDYTGLLKGKNLIAVMLEGIDTWMIDEKHTPTMSYMMKNGINLSNYHSPMFGTGHTLNAEFAFNTGFFNPKSSVSSVNFCTNEYPRAMAQLFKEAGYSVNSFHYNDSEFYNRGILHKALGYEKYNAFTEFGMPETVSQSDSNILKNDGIYQKMTEKQPFFDFIITYSAHVPYTYDDAKLSLAKQNHPDLIDTAMNEEKNNCLILAADTDDFFRKLLTRLDSDGILKDTVIIAFTDHYAYGFSDQKLLEEYKNGEVIYRVPAFIYSPELTAKTVAKPTMTVDWLPTVVNLFGLDRNVACIGNDMLSPENEGFVYFGDSGWLDEDMYFVPERDAVTAETREHILKQNNRMNESFEINETVISGDYFRHR